MPSAASGPVCPVLGLTGEPLLGNRPWVPVPGQIRLARFRWIRLARLGTRASVCRKRPQLLTPSWDRAGVYAVDISDSREVVLMFSSTAVSQRTSLGVV